MRKAEREEWRQIAGYERLYDVSSMGRVRSLSFRNNVVVKTRTPPLTMSQCVNEKGYLSVVLRHNGTARRVGVHILVLLTFVGAKPPGMECAHGDGKPSNNMVENLRWATRSANALDKLGHGTLRYGSKASGARLTEATVAEIRARRASGERTVALAREFGVSYQCVYDAATGRSWVHV